MKGDTEKAASKSSQVVFTPHIPITDRLWIEPPRFALRALAQSAPGRLHHQLHPGEDIEHRVILLPKRRDGAPARPRRSGKRYRIGFKAKSRGKLPVDRVRRI